VTVSDQGGATTRVSDAERDAVVTSLRGHFETGRLDFDEFNERVDETYAARTDADLRRVLRELPLPAVPAAVEPRRASRRHLRAALSRFTLVNGICIGVWAASGAGYFWPIWVLIPTAAVSFSAAMGGRRDADDEPQAADQVQAIPPQQPAPPERQRQRVVMSVLFVDIVSSTERASALGDSAWHVLLADYERVISADVDSYGGDTLFTKGDELVAGFMLPASAVECALKIRDHAKSLGLEVRAGVHAGEVDRIGNQANGIAMHIGRRVSEAAAPGQVLVSSTVHDLLAGSSIAFDAVGERELKGLAGSWRLYQPHP
jgi:class 3 adenylate cyclase